MASPSIRINLPRQELVLENPENPAPMPRFQREGRYRP